MKLLALILSTGLSIVALADDQDARFAALPEGRPVIAPGAIEKSEVAGKFGTVTPVQVEGRPFKKGVRVHTQSRPAEPFLFQLRAATAGPVRKGDKLLAVFEARAIEPQARDGIGEAEFIFELAGEPHTKSASYHLQFGRGWQRFYVPFEARLDHEPGRAAVIFRAGYDPQTIEIGGVQVLDFGPDFPRDKLPRTPVSYAGREPSAPWRKAAAERIDKIRKRDLTVAVVDAEGKPATGAKVRVRLKRHLFGWGSAVDARTLLGSGADNDRYRQVVLENFNKVVLENDLKWPGWQANPKRALEAVAWLRERGLEVRGHCLIWPGRKNLPPSVLPLLTEPEALRRALLEHVTEEAGALREMLVEWDVVNEPYSNVDVQTALSGVARDAAPDAIERHAATLAGFFQAARAADPAARLDINDYSILEARGKDAAHQEHYERTIRHLLAGHAPIGGIGIQGHFSEDLTPVPRLWEILDRFSRFQLPIQITEFDINTADEALQADYTHDFLTAMFAHESVVGVLCWGFWEKRHWVPNAAFYRADWSLRPAGQAWLDLVQKQWRTDAEGVTNARGQWSVRAFRGDYEITAEEGGRRASVQVRHASDAAVTVRITR